MVPDDGVPRIRALLVLADYVNADPSGKANLLGAGIRVIPLQPALPAPPGGSPPLQMTAGFSVFVLLTADLPVGDDAAVELSLHTAAGALIRLPGEGGRSQAIRIAQNVSFATPTSPVVTIPANTLPQQAQMVFNFPTGMPLRAGFAYQFQLRVDHDVVASYVFYVPADRQGPVIG